MPPSGGARSGVLPRQVKLFGWVSLLNDFASEMIYPLLPAFVTGVLGAGPQALGALDERPLVVRIIDRIPMTPGYRPLKGPLRREGIDPARIAGRALCLDPDTGTYHPLDQGRYRRMIGQAPR